MFWQTHVCTVVQEYRTGCST